MLVTIAITTTASGVEQTRRITREAEFPLTFDLSLPAAKAGSLTTRTDDNTGVATLSTGHGIVSSDVVDVYWSGGYRRGMTATVSGNLVTVDGGAGSILPVQTTAVTVSKQVVLPTPTFDGDLTPLWFLNCNTRCALALRDDSAADIDDFEIPAGEAIFWINNMGTTSPIAGNMVGSIVVSNADSSNTASVLRGSFLYDPTV